MRLRLVFDRWNGTSPTGPVRRARVDYPASRGASFLRGARRGQEIRNMEWNSLGLAAGYFCSRASDGGVEPLDFTRASLTRARRWSVRYATAQHD
jgi:hypothetical protein